MKRAPGKATDHAIASVYEQLDYRTLGRVYCYEGGDDFWRAKRRPCIRLGGVVATALRARLGRGGRSLYVGAGVAELPLLMVEVLELHRRVDPYNLRRAEVAVLNRACRAVPVIFRREDASSARGKFDHIWIVSVLNDPERFPQAAALSYGKADPVMFVPQRFERERRIIRRLVDRCMRKLSLPGRVTTSVEEVLWIAEWCHRRHIPYLVEREQFATALVGDPICFMKIGERGGTVKDESRFSSPKDRPNTGVHT
ncbi:MAG TPA: hypothetical protein VH681_01080 [Nitrospiraceae bacterium]